MPIGKVHTVSPLKVQLKGSTVGTPVSLVEDGIPTLTVGDDVWVELDEGKVVVTSKLVAP
jgi:hypothetical protein